MTKNYTCIICPKGCEMEVEADQSGELRVSGALCPKGRQYAEQELHNPLRSIASSVGVAEGEQPLVSVRLGKPIPKEMIFPVMREIRQAAVTAPVHIGDVIIENVLGLGSDVVATRNVGSSGGKTQ